MNSDVVGGLRIEHCAVAVEIDLELVAQLQRHHRILMRGAGQIVAWRETSTA